jgi:hypothetical protein
MKTRHLVQTVLLFLVFLSACKTENALRQNFSGPRKISRYQWIKQDSASGDFNKTIYDIDTLGTIIFWDNSSDTYNQLDFKVKAYPVSWGNSFQKLTSSGAAILWYADWKEAKSFSFFTIPTGVDFVRRVTYTIDKRGDKLRLIGVFSDGKSLYKEILELEAVANSDL